MYVTFHHTSSCLLLTIFYSYEIAWTALIALIAHIFFMHRCFVITRSYAFLVVCGIGAGVAFTAGVASTIGLLRSKYYTCVIPLLRVICDLSNWRLAGARIW